MSEKSKTTNYITPMKALFIGIFCGLTIGYAIGTLIWFTP